MLQIEIETLRKQCVSLTSSSAAANARAAAAESEAAAARATAARERSRGDALMAAHEEAERSASSHMETATRGLAAARAAAAQAEAIAAAAAARDEELSGEVSSLRTLVADLRRREQAALARAAAAEQRADMMERTCGEVGREMAEARAGQEALEGTLATLRDQLGACMAQHTALQQAHKELLSRTAHRGDTCNGGDTSTCCTEPSTPHATPPATPHRVAPLTLADELGQSPFRPRASIATLTSTEAWGSLLAAWDGTPGGWLQALCEQALCSDVMVDLGPTAAPVRAHAAVLACCPALAQRVRDGRVQLREWSADVGLQVCRPLCCSCYSPPFSCR
jgi:hypothetical protein